MDTSSKESKKIQDRSEGVGREQRIQAEELTGKKIETETPTTKSEDNQFLEQKAGKRVEERLIDIMNDPRSLEGEKERAEQEMLRREERWIDGIRKRGGDFMPLVMKEKREGVGEVAE